jgi:hypothetical protein
MSQQVEPVIVSGGQGSGKTTYLREMHARYDGCSVFMTTKGGERKAHDRPPKRVRKSSAVYPEDIRRVREWAHDRSEEVQVIIDECQNAPTFTTGDGPIQTMLHEDREAGVKTVIATQSPSDLRTKENGYAPVQQCDWWVWCGPLKSWHAGFFNANGLSDVKRLMPTEKYKYAVLKPIESLPPEEQVVDRGSTDKRFG